MDYSADVDTAAFDNDYVVVDVADSELKVVHRDCLIYYVSQNLFHHAAYIKIKKQFELERKRQFKK